MENEKKAPRLIDGSHYGWYIALGAVIIAQLAFYIYRFFMPDMRHFIDCYFRYGLANSYYKPFINFGEGGGGFWITGKDLLHYLMPTKETAFKYGSVWFNQEQDANPPLYYALLHTICSFFPEKFSWWYGLSINIVCFITTQLCMFKLIKHLCGTPLPALITCLFYGFTKVSYNNQEIIGMYSMLTMFAILMTYLTAKMINKEEKLSIPKDLLPIALIVFCGSMTQHVFLMFAFCLTLFTCIYLLLRKRIFNCFSYGFSALLGVILSFAAFPAAVMHVLERSSENDGVYSPLPWSGQPDFNQNVYQLYVLVVGELTGISINMFKDYTGIYVFVVFVFLLLPIGGFCFLMRDKPWFKNAVSKVWEALKAFWRSDYFYIVIVGLAFLGTYCIGCTQFYYWDIQLGITRYFYQIIPLLLVVIAAVVYHIIKAIKFKYIRMILCASISVVLALTAFKQSIDLYSFSGYLVPNQNTNGSIENIITDKDDCLVVVNNVFYASNMLEYLYKANDIFICTYMDPQGGYQTCYEEIDKFKDSDSFYLLVDNHYQINGEVMEELDEAGVLGGYDKNKQLGYDKETGEYAHTVAIKDIEERLGCKAEFVTKQMLYSDLDVFMYRMVKQ